MLHVFFTLNYPPLSGVGVYPLSSLLASAVSPETPIFISRLYFFDSLIFVRFLTVICLICRYSFESWLFLVFKLKILSKICIIYHLPFKTQYQEVFHADNKRKFSQKHSVYITSMILGLFHFL